MCCADTLRRRFVTQRSLAAGVSSDNPANLAIRGQDSATSGVHPKPRQRQHKIHQNLLLQVAEPRVG